MTPCNRSFRVLALASMLMATAVSAGEVTIPHSFSANTPAVAAEVNANFGAVDVAVDDNAVDIAAMQSALATLQTTVGNLQTTVNTQQATIDAQATTIDALQSDLTALQSNSVLALDGILSLGADANGYATAQFTDVNVHIVNGMGSTSTTNGLGNLTIGYNEPDTFQAPFCSDGTYVDQASCDAAGEIWAVNQRSGSHNLILGNGNAYSQSGGIVAGTVNIINRMGASVTGGTFNVASGFYSSVSGGSHNTASGQFAAVSGGRFGSAKGTASTISGGRFNLVTGDFSSISGGYQSYAYADYSSISGGQFNSTGDPSDPLVGQYSSVSGGKSNHTDGDHSSVSGGEDNIASGVFSSVSGGHNSDSSAAIGTTPEHNWRGGSLVEDN